MQVAELLLVLVGAEMGCTETACGCADYLPDDLVAEKDILPHRLRRLLVVEEAARVAALPLIEVRVFAASMVQEPRAITRERRIGLAAAPEEFPGHRVYRLHVHFGQACMDLGGSIDVLRGVAVEREDEEKLVKTRRASVGGVACKDGGGAELQPQPLRKLGGGVVHRGPRS